MAMIPDDVKIAAEEEWWRENQCRDCDHMSPACFDGDQMALCMEIAFDFSPELRAEMEAAVAEELEGATV